MSPVDDEFERDSTPLGEEAESAARSFLGGTSDLEFIGQSQVAAYRVETSKGRYLLRLHLPTRGTGDASFRSIEAIESECAWLEALDRDTDLVVQRPLPGPGGGFVHPVASSGGEQIPCTLLCWVEGEPPGDQRTPEEARQLGRLLAALHDHASRWARPPGFDRPSFDAATWLSALERFDLLVRAGVATSENRELLGRAMERVAEEVFPLESDPTRSGLIHADLHRGNYVMDKGVPRPIDFGRAGFGPWLYDVAETLGDLGPERRRELVDTYAEQRPLEPGDIARIEGYFLAGLIEVFGNNAADIREHGYLGRAIPAWSPHFRRYAEGADFLFEL